MVKVFLSHQQADSLIAGQIAAYLKVRHQIDSYLDVVDTSIKNGEDLADHLKSEMSKCTQLLAVVSNSTSLSQWVPWEIGVATEKDFPLATYSSSSSLPPEFLRKWPYLRSMPELDLYAKASKDASSSYVRRRSALNEAVETARASSTKLFYRTLRSSLGQ